MYISSNKYVRSRTCTISHALIWQNGEIICPIENCAILSATILPK